MSNVKGIIDVVSWMHLYQRIVVDKIVDFRGSKEETGNDFAWMKGLPSTSNYSSFDHLDDAIRKQLGMDAQIFVASEIL